MNLQKRLIKLSEYKCSFEYVENYFLISVVYPEGWSIVPSSKEGITIKTKDGVTYYVADANMEMDDIFDVVDETIRYNFDIDKKVSLLNHYVIKLRELFSSNDLERLEKLTFEFKDVQSKPKKTNVKKTTKPKNTNKTVSTNSVDTGKMGFDPSTYEDPSIDHNANLEINNN